MSMSYTADHLRVRCGVLNPPKDEKFIITVNARDIDAFNVTEDDIKYLDGIMVEASEKNTKKEANETEKKTTDTVKYNKYTKTFDTNIYVDYILIKMKTKGYIKPYKVNLYTEGASHKDDEPTKGSKGMIVLVLPTKYTGGEYVFSTFRVEDNLPKDKIRFVYFETDLEHSIEKVLSGNRITLVYNIFDGKANSNIVRPDIALKSAPAELYGKLLQEAVEFCRDKQNVLLGKSKYDVKMFQKLRNDLQRHYTIIKVSLDEYAGENDITNITEVYEIDEDDEAEEWYDQKGDDFQDYILKIHQVQHILFPASSEVGEKREMFKTAHGEDEDFTIKFYRCFLINHDKKAAEWADTRAAKRARY